MISPESKMRSPDRILVLEAPDGKPLSTQGLIDKRLFTGENKLHAIKEEATNFWYFKYDMGIVPDPLKQKFTSFKALLKHAQSYFDKRNIKITEVID